MRWFLPFSLSVGCFDPTSRQAVQEGIDASDCDIAWYPDADGDEFGSPISYVEACSAPEGYVRNSEDCNDQDPDIRPTTPELCDALDRNCDGDPVLASADADQWLADADGDGFGAGTVTPACDAPEGFVAADLVDCDDSIADVFPDAVEYCNDRDDDCDDETDEDAVDPDTWYLDDDGDGFGDAVHPTEACDAPADHVADSTDCNDADEAIHPGADETCDETDRDCDGDPDDGATDATVWFLDSDDDGYGDYLEPRTVCTTPPQNTVDNGEDCDDSDGDINPLADEYCDGIDEDCDGTPDDDALDAVSVYIDADGDGFGTGVAQTIGCPGSGLSDTNGDCNDADGSAYPGATELCDGLVQDCNRTDEDGVVTSVGPNGKARDESSEFSQASVRVVTDVDGDTWSFCPGHYLVRFETTGSAIWTLEGRGGAARVILDADGTGSVLTVHDDDVSVTGVTLTGGVAQGTGITHGGGIYADDANVVVESCVITGNEAAYGGGIGAYMNSTLSIVDSTLTDNEATEYGGALYLGFSVDAVLDEVVFEDNLAGAGGGAVMTSTCAVHVNGGRMEDNEAGNSGGALYRGEDAPEVDLTAVVLTGNEPDELYDAIDHSHIELASPATLTCASGAACP